VYILNVLVHFESRPKYTPGTKEVRILRVDGRRVDKLFASAG